MSLKQLFDHNAGRQMMPRRSFSPRPRKRLAGRARDAILSTVEGSNNPLTGEQVVYKIRERTDTILLSFSTGKDSIAAWLELRKPQYGFKRIIPAYLYTVPGLEFVEESLRYYEDFFQTEIHRMPHECFYRFMNGLIWQPPEHCRIIELSLFPLPSLDDILSYLAQDMGFQERPWAATGVRAADSPIRRAAISKYGAINEKRRTFFPVWDWNKERLISEITAAGVKLPVDYRVWGRSFDGLDRRFMEPMRKHFPKDYARILEFFPLVDADIYRKEFFGGKTGN